MLPVRNFYIDSYQMEIVLGESSDDDLDTILISAGSDELSDSDASEGTLDDQEDDPDYEPEGAAMDSTQENTETEPQPLPGNDETSAASANCEGDVEVKNEPDDANDRPIAATQKNSEDDGQNCTICFEPWSNTSEHRLVSLRCGHLFGRSCITRWLKGQNTRCPQCNSRARKSEIRNIYARAIKVMDSSERDKALHDLAKEIELRKAAEKCAAEERLRCHLAVQEYERMKKEYIEVKMQLQEYRAKAGISLQTQFASNQPSFSLVHTIEIRKEGGCRIVNSNDMLGMILVSQPSYNPLFTGFGFRKISSSNMKASEFVLVHQKPIRDMALHMHDGLVLTGSQDKTFKITNILSNSVVQTYQLPSEAWSCAWDVDDSTYFYGGLRTGEVLLYDIRVTDRYVHELPNYGMKTPVVSLQYLCQPYSASHRKSGPLIGKLSDCFFYPKNSMTPNEYKTVQLPTLGSVICLSSIPSGHCLVSCRPSAKSANVSHTVCDFETAPSKELVCCPVKTLLGGKNQLHLTRTKLLSHPDKESSSLVCVGDDDSQSILVWDGSSGKQLAGLKISDKSVSDICGMKINHKFYLTALTQKNLLIYGWNGV